MVMSVAKVMVIGVVLFCILLVASWYAFSCYWNTDTTETEDGASNSASLPEGVMKVEGRFLYDKCGEKVVLRGVNAMIVYWDREGTVTFPEIAKTGASCVRIFWKLDQPTPTPEELDLAIANCIANEMIPMVGLWDATSDWSKLGFCVDWWTSPEIVEVVKKHEDYLLVNIANEAGDFSVTEKEFQDGYEVSISRMRDAGIHTPLVIDAAGWGRGEDYILNTGQNLLDADPDHNLIFSWHPWDPVNRGGSKERIKAAIDASISKNICMIIGEFSRCEFCDDCEGKPIEWQYIMEYAGKNEIGWLAWVWWCCEDPADCHSITTDKIYSHWNNPPWGEEVAVTSPYSIKNTSVRPYSIVHGHCQNSTSTKENT